MEVRSSGRIDSRFRNNGVVWYGRKVNRRKDVLSSCTLEDGLLASAAYEFDFRNIPKSSDEPVNGLHGRVQQQSTSNKG